MKTLFAVVILMCVSGCTQCTQPPISRTEEFRLRGECVKLRDKIQENQKDWATPGGYDSNYNVQDNRCYVTHTWSELDPNDRYTGMYVSLRDGQTDKEIAWTSVLHSFVGNPDKYDGDLSLAPGNSTSGYNKARTRIKAAMGETIQ